jgi:TolA-binding protein
MRLTLIVALLVAGTLNAAPPTTCGADDAYSKALCAYQLRDFHEAEAGFREIAATGESAQTIRALYFLARTEMKLGRFDEASTIFIRIYASAPSFYREWNCDFLLGECRKATGKG